MSIVHDDIAKKYISTDSAYCARVISENEILFLSKKSGSPQVWIRYQNGDIKQLTNLNENILDIIPSPSGKKAALIVDYEGNELTHIYIMNLSNLNIKKLVPSSKDLYHFGGWSFCGEKIIWSSNKKNKKYFDIYVQNILTKDYNLYYSTKEVCQPVEWLPDGEHVLINIEKTNIDKTIHLINLNKRTFTPLFKDNILSRFEWIKSFQKGKKGYFLSDMKTDFMSLYEICLESFAINLVMKEKFDIEKAVLSLDEKSLLYTVNYNGNDELFLLDIKKNKSRLLIKDNENRVISDLEWIDNHTFIFTFSNSITPGNAWKYNIESNELEQLTYFNYPINLSFKKPIRDKYYSFDNLKVPYFYYSNVDKNSPAVIYIHEGPESQYKPKFNPLFQYLRYIGISVIAPNIRGSTGYGRNYLMLDDKEKRMDALNDIVYLVRSLVSKNKIDSKRIVIMGHSYGAFMTNLALTHFPSYWAGGVSLMGISHLNSFFKSIDKWRKPLRQYEYGEIDYYHCFFEKISPLNFIKDIQSPLMLIHGQYDMQVPFNESFQMARELEKKYKSYEFLNLENEGHYLNKKENIIEVNLEIINFIKRLIK